MKGVLHESNPLLLSTLQFLNVHTVYTQSLDVYPEMYVRI